MYVFGHKHKPDQHHPCFPAGGFDALRQLLPPRVIGQQRHWPIARERQLVQMADIVKMSYLFSMCHGRVLCTTPRKVHPSKALEKPVAHNLNSVPSVASGGGNRLSYLSCALSATFPACIISPILYSLVPIAAPAIARMYLESAVVMHCSGVSYVNTTTIIAKFCGDVRGS